MPYKIRTLSKRLLAFLTGVPFDFEMHSWSMTCKVVLFTKRPVAQCAMKGFKSIVYGSNVLVEMRTLSKKLIAAFWTFERSFGTCSRMLIRIARTHNSVPVGSGPRIGWTRSRGWSCSNSWHIAGNATVATESANSGCSRHIFFSLRLKEGADSRTCTKSRDRVEKKGSARN